MNIVHVYAKNLEIFVDAVKGTDCKLNASCDINYMLGSLRNFNARDVVGLIVFANPMTKKCTELVKRFDDLFVFKRLPIIVISDAATALYEQGYFRTKHSKVFLMDSEEDSISDLDISSIFTTIFAYTSSLYDLSVIPAEKARRNKYKTGEAKELVMSDQLSSLLDHLKGSSAHATEKGTQKG